MELLPYDPITPERWNIAFLRSTPILFVEQIDVLICRHDLDDLFCSERALGMHVAPPVDRLHPSRNAHPTMVPQKRAKLRVDASFDPIGGRGHRSFDAESRVEIGEQGSFVDERNERASRFSQPLVRITHATIDKALLGEKAVPEIAPLKEPLHPPIGLLERPDMQELLRVLVELNARFEVRSGRRISFDLAERMEEASLNEGIRPASPSRFRKASATIGDDHIGRSDAREERLPRPRCLGACKIPR